MASITVNGIPAEGTTLSFGRTGHVNVLTFTHTEEGGGPEFISVDSMMAYDVVASIIAQSLRDLNVPNTLISYDGEGTTISLTNQSTAGNDPLRLSTDASQLALVGISSDPSVAGVFVPA